MRKILIACLVFSLMLAGTASMLGDGSHFGQDGRRGPAPNSGDGIPDGPGW